MNERVDLKLVDCRLAVTDSPVADLPYQIACREESHNDDTASLAVYSDHIHCFGCGFHIARRIESLAYLLNGSVTPQSIHDAIKRASKYTTESLDAYRDRVGEQARMDPLPLSLAKSYQSLLWGMRSSRLKWLEDRGLGKGTIYASVLGHDSTRFTIPFYSSTVNERGEYELVTIRFRRDDEYGTTTFDERPIPKYSGMRGRNGQYLYPEWILDKSAGDDYLVVVEGELDALLCWQEGLQAVSTTNGAGNMHKVVDQLESFYQRTGHPRFKRLVICGDMDEPGRAASIETGRVAKQAGYETRIIQWDSSLGKDVSEYFVNTGGLDLL